jgi:hypothetical protein
VPEIFFDPTGRPSLAAGRAWSADSADEIMRHCTGAAIIGLPRWIFDTPDGPVRLPTEFCHYEGGLARSMGLPLLVLAERDLLRRVVFDPSFGPYIGEIPRDADTTWLESPQFGVTFDYWKKGLSARRDVFLGYCGAASELAQTILGFLEGQLGAKVLDWRRDFAPGRSILAEIDEARNRCMTGVFLFTKDDPLTHPASGNDASPRDNVVFEAGYFAAAKGKARVLIIRERGAKMPADLGGDIYASVDDRADLSPVEDALTRFMTAL